MTHPWRKPKDRQWNGGERVSFNNTYGKVITGVVVRYEVGKGTLRIKPDDGSTHWHIDPVSVTRIK
jgi:hypothetical protein